MQPKNKNLSEKELLALQDQLGVEQNVKMKYDFYAQNMQDPQLKKKVQQVAKKHQDHFNALTLYLQQ